MISPWDPESGARLLVSFAKIDFHDDFSVSPEDVTLDKKMYADEFMEIPI
jgi:hypothetical protein